MAGLATFDDWIDLFHQWQREIDLDTSQLADFTFDIKFGEAAAEIEFGQFAGRPKWERVTEIPEQRIQDHLLKLIVVQGDAEFGSVELERSLFATAPSEYDRRSLARILAEETRHGWQMAYLLVTYFGSDGRREAEKLLQRRSDNRSRLLGTFNEEMNDWLDLFVHTYAMDRVGKYQLQMLQHSSFAPLARSTGPMLREESFHLGTGKTGLKRLLRAGRIPVDLLQKYLNKWVPAGYDMFGRDQSASAAQAYEWGLKGRVDEGATTEPADLQRLNETARDRYIQELAKLTDDLNRLIPDEQPKLYLPDVKFNRRIGIYAEQPFDVHGNPLPEASYGAYLAEALPGAADRARLAEITKTRDWIAPRGEAA